MPRGASTGGSQTSLQTRKGGSRGSPALTCQHSHFSWESNPIISTRKEIWYLMAQRNIQIMEEAGKLQLEKGSNPMSYTFPQIRVCLGQSLSGSEQQQRLFGNIHTAPALFTIWALHQRGVTDGDTTSLPQGDLSYLQKRSLLSLVPHIPPPPPATSTLCSNYLQRNCAGQC